MSPNLLYVAKFLDIVAIKFDAGYRSGKPPPLVVCQMRKISVFGATNFDAGYRLGKSLALTHQTSEISFSGAMKFSTQSIVLSARPWQTGYQACCTILGTLVHHKLLYPPSTFVA